MNRESTLRIKLLDDAIIKARVQVALVELIAEQLRYEDGVTLKYQLSHVTKRLGHRKRLK